MNPIPLQGHLTHFSGPLSDSGPTRPAAIPRFGHMPEAADSLNDLQDDFHRAPSHPSKVHSSKPRPGKYKNNFRELASIIVLNFLPLSLAVISMAGWPGFLLSLAFMPILFLTGKLGRSLRKQVDPDTLVGPLKLFHKLHDLLHPTLSPREKQELQARLDSAPTPQARQAILKELGARDHTDKINQALSDFLASLKMPRQVLTIPGKLLAAIPDGLLRQFTVLPREEIRRSLLSMFRIDSRLLNMLRINNKTWFGKALNRYINNGTLFRNQLFTGISNSETVFGALAVGARGARDGFVDFVLMPKIGQWLEWFSRLPVCPAYLKLALVPVISALKNWFAAKSFVDLGSILQMMRGNALPRTS